MARHGACTTLDEMRSRTVTTAIDRSILDGVVGGLPANLCRKLYGAMPDPDERAAANVECLNLGRPEWMKVKLADKR